MLLKVLRDPPMVCSVDRRLHYRALADLDIEVVRITNKDQIVAGRLEDISKAGMCLILPCELAPEEIVRLEAAENALDADADIAA